MGLRVGKSGGRGRAGRMFEFGFYLILEAERENRQQRLSCWAMPWAAVGCRKCSGCRGQIGLEARSWEEDAAAGKDQEACLGRRRGRGDDRGRAELVSMRGREVPRAGPGSGHRRGRERAWGRVCIGRGERDEARGLLRGVEVGAQRLAGELRGRHGHWWAPLLARC